MLKRIFRKEINTDETVTHANPCTAHNPILVYLDSFLPASNETLYPLAAYFWSSIAASAIFFTRKTGAALLSETLIVIGKHCAPIAENSGLRKHDTDIKTMTSFVTKTALQFEPRSLFLLFIGLLYHLLSESAGNSCTAGMLACRSLLKTHAEEARLAVETFNQSPVLALERLAFELRTGLVKLNGGAG